MMKTKLKKSLLAVGFGTLFIAGLAGSISGSLAWWAYSTRAAVSYQGTSVSSSEQLQIGIKTDVVFPNGYGMTQETIGGVKYSFSDPGTGLPAETIAYYLTHSNSGYAVNQLEPITTGAYSSGDITLYNPVVSGQISNISEDNHADHDRYVYLPLAFRVLRYEGGTNRVYVGGENIWLSKTSVEASGEAVDNQVYKAIRMFTSGVYKNPNTGEMDDAKYLINPSSDESVQGKTAVAGPLDISGSHTYDTYEKNGKTYTIIYGQSNKSEQQLLDLQTNAPRSEPTDIVDINKTGNEEEYSTFTSSIARGTYYPSLNPEDYDDVIDPKYQYYDTLNTVKADDEGGVLSGGSPLCATDPTSKVADLDLTIWLEGWDHKVIDKENHHSFNLGLQFQITRI